MELTYRKLTEVEAAGALSEIPEWSLEHGMLTRLCEFPTYKDGLVFAMAVGYVADKLNHHPDLHVGYGKVRVATVTHDAGGLTAYDFELARRVDGLL
ncbi:MAG: 4a-hydroxytetrahydrobiopterin dehydratase [Fimbriimonadaceae bacterium]|nr:4a-hydroxytetrahydrobiopterin dehydratase [Fimbriimonadaceae bacterium]QYK58857.1 MAG: 4a-hydroxytetrahydrobiopterin dehydratase [Fimbriimonadaceae bacterium]